MPRSTESTPAPLKSTRKHVRGSSLLLLGRGLSVVINFVVQVLIVRMLTVGDFGAFAYALATVALLSTLIELGLGKGLSRYLPIYQEQKDYRLLFGGILLGFGSIALFGAAVVVSLFALQGFIRAELVSSPLSLAVLLILVVLAPLQALESVIEKMLAVFAGARAVFFRRHLLGPLLKLAAVCAVMLFSNNVQVLAFAYLGAGIVGLMISLVVLLQVLRSRGLAEHFAWGQCQLPIRDVYGFSLPLLSSDLVFMSRAAVVVFLLEFFVGSAAVAAFRAVFPVARLNMIVFDSFKTLYVPTAARLFARDDHRSISDLYWQNATWLAVLTFPLFIATFSLAYPTTTLLFGDRYAGSASILAILSLGCYAHVVFGFNTLTLRVYNRVRSIVIIDVAAATLAIAANCILIPRYGAVGGAWATCGTLLLQNLLHQVVLVRGGHVAAMDARFAQSAATLVSGALLLLLAQSLLRPSMPVAIGLGISTVAIVSWLNLRHLDVESTFPELQRFLRVPYRLRLRQS
ncbi:oligosaccharide flippase family protein [Candidatus Laterigemmans baculatus]|uniref:oligosaccharide flippase family protein n=1 Tax=Candidatus Laterigemmans baculatus TaxID=2770505 RepID=UPI001F266287|nr:oligosaccharide flippase family protein [Candidatus Laterigemmans baculatus]